MDIAVDFLNRRLAAQLPSELPLGLVFVVGEVSQVWPNMVDENGRFPIHQFELVEGDYRLRCVVPPERVGEIQVKVGERVRAGGHLTFDRWRVSYVLLARDVALLAEDLQQVVPTEIAASAKEHEQLRAALKNVKKRADAARDSREKLPPWVEKLGPAAATDKAEKEANGTGDTAVTRSEKILVPDLPVPGKADLQPQLVDALSEAIDSEQEIELTPDMVTTLGTTHKAPVSQSPVPTSIAETPADLTDLPTSYQPHSETRRPDWLIFIMMAILVMLTIAAVLSAIYLFAN